MQRRIDNRKAVCYQYHVMYCIIQSISVLSKPSYTLDIAL